MHHLSLSETRALKLLLTAESAALATIFFQKQPEEKKYFYLSDGLNTNRNCFVWIKRLLVKLKIIVSFWRCV
jgi:hypothetical protein